MVALLAVPVAQACRPSLTAWVHSDFARCVRLRESHDGRDPNAGGNLYGVQRNGGYSWAAGLARAAQDRIAYQLWCRWGDQPWRPYDGCAW